MGEDLRKHNAFGVVVEDKDVGRFEQGVAADVHPGRNAVKNGAFGDTDEGLGALVVVILVQVERDNETRLGFVAYLAFHKNEAVMRFKDARIQVVLHCLLGLANAVLYIWAVEPGFGEDEVEGGGGIANGFSDLFPVFRL